MSSVDSRPPHSSLHPEYDDQEISEQLKKCSEENQQKLKQAKNLEDLVKINLSTVNTTKKDKNLYWRNLVNNDIKVAEESKQSWNPKEHDSMGDSREPFVNSLNNDLNTQPPPSHVIQNFERKKEKALNEGSQKFDSNVDPIVHLKNYFRRKEYIPDKKKLKPFKKIVYKDKTAELMNMLHNPYDVNNMPGDMQKLK